MLLKLRRLVPKMISTFRLFPKYLNLYILCDIDDAYFYSLITSKTSEIEYE